MVRKKEKFSRYDVADYLKSDEELAAYLDACMEEAGDDAAYIAAALGDIARARGMAQLAKDTGISRGVVQSSFAGRQPEPRDGA